ncbi:RNA polymerase sigma factor [Aquimarina pacifica]|uniref:RNA polymerase sigma factor n=1 Tax=Aquimarina pacifica TaxID=1296415 RepID=UPI0006850017|nr:RNA polymerase sigma factor [Aquimarina pacifica]
MHKLSIMVDKEQVIIKGILNGDDRILTRFYRDNIRYIRGYIVNNSGNSEDVEDVFQDALVVLYQKLKSGDFVIKVALKTYFYGICKNVWRNRLRKKDLLIFDGQNRIEQEAHDSIIGDIEYQEREHLYRKHFQRLSPDNRKLLHLFFEGRSMKEISNVTGCSLGSARKRKFDAKKKLLQMIEKDPAYNELRTIY